MTNRAMKESFLKAYDNNVDDIFTYCLRETAHRDVAKYLTRNVFAEVWDTIVYYGFDSISNIKRLIFRTAKDHVTMFNAGKQNEQTYYNNLWNLTLTQ
jgi:hypothetical protein